MSVLIADAHRRKLIIQFLEYMVGGGFYFWSGYAIFAICYSGLGWDWFPAKILADIIGFSLNFIIQRYWAFNDPRLKHHGVRISGRYILVTAINFIVDYAIVGGLNTLGITPYIGLFAAAAFFTAWNYLWYRFWVFNPKQDSTKPKSRCLCWL